MKKHSEDGAAALEFAILLPILMLILFGIIEFGFLLNRYVSVTAAAREGARVMSLGFDQSESEERAVATTPELTGDLSCEGSEETGVSGEAEVVMHCEAIYDLSLFAVNKPIVVESTARMRKEGG